MGGTELPTFSIVIPTYGRPAFLAEALQSVLAQSFEDFEVLIVDDASPEPVAIEHDDSRVRVLRTPKNVGPAGARNYGAEQAVGAAIAFLDDDDVWHEDRLSFAVQALERAPIAVCWQSSSGGRHLDGMVHGKILDAMTPHMGATAVLRSAWVPMDNSYRAGEDLAWWLEVTKEWPLATTASQGLSVRRHTGARQGYGATERIAASHRLLWEQAEYFQGHPRAASFRWKRIGLMHLQSNQRHQARAAFMNSLRLRPSAADVVHLLDTFRPWAPTRR